MGNVCVCVRVHECLHARTMGMDRLGTIILLILYNVKRTAVMFFWCSLTSISNYGSVFTKIYLKYAFIS